MLDYTELEVWIEARKLANMTYGITQNFPKNELYGLTSQMRRSSVSIASNIAEGCGRRTNADTTQFLHVARGSLYELETQFYIAHDQSLIGEKEFEQIKLQILSCKKLINGFINYYKSKRN